MARHCGGVLGILALGGIVALLVVPAVSASLYQFYDGVGDPPPNYPAGGTGIDVFRNSWAAQSFAAGANYTLTRVDLWAAANSVAGLNATLLLTTDSGGSPNLAAPSLARAMVTAPTLYGWVSFNLAPNVALSRGAVYWLVLESNATSGSQGWSWWNTANTSVIAGGRGVLSGDSGATWGPAAGDFEARTFGFIEAAVTVAAAVNVVAPRAGDTVILSVWFNNTGTVPAASLWINDTLPGGLTIASDNASASGGVRTGNANWTFSDVGPGVHYFFIGLSVDPGLANHSYLVDRLDLAYTDFRGQPMPGSSIAVTITVSGTVSAEARGLGLVPMIVSALLGGWILLVALWPRGKLEEAFLVDNNGVLVAHLSRVAERVPDHDIFAGMLTAVQDFIHESFSRSGGGSLRHLDFGRRKIFIRRGEHAFLAIVLNGRTPPTLRRRMARTLERIEASYGHALDRWSGDMREVAGTAEALSAELLS